MKIISADERLKQQTGVKIAIFGQYGIGKTSLLKTIDVPTLCIDFEAGLLAVQNWNGDSISIRTWEDARDIACLVGGANPASKGVYGNKFFNAIKEKYSDFDFSKYQCIFIDSITIASKICLTWCKSQPEAISDRNGKIDLRNVYGILASEMNSWINQFQYIPNKDVVFVGLLDSKVDDFNKTHFIPQIEGSKTTSELPGIIDEVISMVAIKSNSGELERKFICTTLNKLGYPAKDRSGLLNEFEDAHLGRLLKKIRR